MFETCMNNIYYFIDDLLIILRIRKEEKSNFYDDNLVNYIEIK